jgi:hypothetical protein
VARLIGKAMKGGAYNTESLIEFLTELRKHFDGEPLIVICDGLPSHRSRAMSEWLATQRHRLRWQAASKSADSEFG